MVNSEIREFTFSLKLNTEQVKSACTLENNGKVFILEYHLNTGY